MAASENETEILRIVRSIRDSVGLLPDKVADQVVDRLSSAAAVPARVPEPEPPKDEVSELTATAPETISSSMPSLALSA